MKRDPAKEGDGRRFARTGACARAGDSTAWLTGELPAAERAAFEAHLNGCGICRDAVQADRRILNRLGAVPPAEVSHDLAPELAAKAAAARLARDASARTWRRVRLAAVAALVLILAGGGLRVWQRGSRAPAISSLARASAAAQAMDWLCRTQETDGSWSSARWGGDKRYQVALTALSLLALLDPQPSASDARLAAVRRAGAYLKSQQNQHGEFGPAFDGAPYNQGIATLALLRAYGNRKDPGLKEPLDAAIGLICGRQSRDGGWGYRGASATAANLSVTLWQVEALKLAASLGWENVAPNVERGLRWVAGMADDQGFFGYRQASDFPSGPQTLTAMGAMSVLDSPYARLLSPARRQAIRTQVAQAAKASGSDIDFYRAYFLAVALKQMKEEESAVRLASLRRNLMARQAQAGADSGSWTPDDQWGNVGGRLYATALASLALR